MDSRRRKFVYILSNVLLLKYASFLQCLSLIPFPPVKYNTDINYKENFIYRGADKSLARPGRKQATATEEFDVHMSYL